MDADPNVIGLVPEGDDLPDSAPSPEGDSLALSSDDPQVSEPESVGPDSDTGESPSDGGADAATESPGEQGDAPAEPAAAAQESFDWAGKTYKSREDAENDTKAWLGRLEQAQELAETRTKQANEYYEYVTAISKENDMLRERLEALDKGDSAPAPNGKDKEKGVGPIDWDQLARIRAHAEKLGMDPVATVLKTYHEKMEAAYEEKLQKRLESISAPIEQMEQEKMATQANRELFLWAQSQRLRDGRAAYPELQKEAVDEAFITKMYDIWGKLNSQYGAAFAYSAGGIDFAYRLAKEGTPAPSPSPAASPPRDAQGRFMPARNDAATASELTGTQPNPAKPRKSRVQEALEELGAHKPVKHGETELGFFE